MSQIEKLFEINCIQHQEAMINSIYTQSNFLKITDCVPYERSKAFKEILKNWCLEVLRAGFFCGCRVGAEITNDLLKKTEDNKKTD